VVINSLNIIFVRLFVQFMFPVCWNLSVANLVTQPLYLSGNCDRRWRTHPAVTSLGLQNARAAEVNT
jgi:hypothetical protein